MKLRTISEIEGKEETIKNKIKTIYEMDSFVKIDNADVTIVVIGQEHDITLANKIMNTIQSEFDNKVSISIKFA